ncbi:unnamed protein product, partial [Polarella glacialis]
VGVLAPVLPLALVPSNSRSLGRDYGFLESLFSVAQIFFIFAIGVLREWDEFDDFHSVLVFVTAGFGISIILVLVLARVVRDELADSRRSPHLDLAVRVPRYR